MLLGGIALGLIIGLLAGGNLGNLVSVRLRWVGLLFGAVIVRFAAEAALVRGYDVVDALRLPIYATSYGMLLAALWMNRRHPGMAVAFVGILSNAVVTLANGGYMPVWAPSLEAAGFRVSDIETGLHVVLGTPIDPAFLLHAGPLGDVIPVPAPFIQNVISVGDILISFGLAFFLFATLVQSPDELEAADTERSRRLAGFAGSARLRAPGWIPRPDVGAETGLAAGLAESSLLQRPALLGSAGPGGGGLAAASPALTPLQLGVDGGGAIAAAPSRTAIPLVPPIAERVRRHPYVQLALNGSFSALWVGQLISLFGDRIHQVALAFLVLGVTNSPLAVGLVFLAATAPNLLLGPIAGTFVDRWDQKEVMVVSDLLRASVVLLVPVLAVVNIWLVYPAVFVLTSISIFFRPARTAVLPRIVREDELMTANSSIWIVETLADIVGYPIAGLFVAFVGSALPLAFWIDGASYVASALLIVTMAIPAVRRTTGGGAEEGEGAAGVSFRREFLDGWHFLRGETVLLANTLQGVAGQFAIGALAALTAVYARDVLQRGTVDAVAAYAFLETSIGVGNLAGGFVIGLIGSRLAKGHLVIGGYAAWGLCLTAVGFTGSLPLALGLYAGMGVANMVYIIPSQTLFQQRTPEDLIGRVVGFRFALVSASLMLAMALSGGLAELVGVGAVVTATGLLATAAGLAGLLVRSVREA